MDQVLWFRTDGGLRVRLGDVVRHEGGTLEYVTESGTLGILSQADVLLTNGGRYELERAK